jgi:hypothetical protein
METVIESLRSPYILAYLAIIFAVVAVHSRWIHHRRRKTERRREKAGLPRDVLVDHAVDLQRRRRDSRNEALLLLGTILLAPVALTIFAGTYDTDHLETAQQGVALTFLVLLIWVLVNGTEVSKAYLGGLAFKTLAAFKAPFQVGDRVTLKGVSGRVTGFNTFFVTLQTQNDDQVSIPTSSLWDEVLSSSNSGARYSLCVIDFFLSPFVSGEQRQQAEDAIWDAIQASPYYDSSHPMQIYLRQTENAIQLTAKAYVALTYNEPLFVSDITRAFLAYAERTGLPLASNAWRVNVANRSH